jgi:preprotein translocase subunit SecE
VKGLLPILIGVAIALVIFAFMWRQGAFLKLSSYFDETKEELRKCTWPTRPELWQSTQVVFVAILALGFFTMIIDFLVASFIKWIV